MSAANHDPFGLGGQQREDAELLSASVRRPTALNWGKTPIAELWAEHELIGSYARRLPMDCSEAEESGAERLLARAGDLVDEIAGRVARDEAGLIAQLHMLAQHHQDFRWGRFGDELVGKLIAGIAILGEKEA
jgi:hypothetical protein